MKMFTMFQNQPNKYFRVIANNARNFEYRRGGDTKRLFNILMGWAVIPAMWQFIADAFQFKGKHQARALVLGPLNYLLIWSQMAQSIYGWVTDEPFNHQASPVYATMDDLQKALRKVRSMDPTEGIEVDDIIAAIEYFGKAGGQLTGIPVPYAIQVEKAIRKGDIKEFFFSEFSLRKDGEEKKKQSRPRLD